MAEMWAYGLVSKANQSTALSNITFGSTDTIIIENHIT